MACWQAEHAGRAFLQSCRGRGLKIMLLPHERLPVQQDLKRLGPCNAVIKRCCVQHWQGQLHASVSM